MRRVADRLRQARLAFAGVFRNPGLRRLELAWAFSIVGSWAYSVAVVVFAYQQGGARAVGLVGLLRWVAAGVASPFAAVLGDRYGQGLPRDRGSRVRLGAPDRPTPGAGPRCFVRARGIRLGGAARRRSRDRPRPQGRSARRAVRRPDIRRWVARRAHRGDRA